mgnify:FL=1
MDGIANWTLDYWTTHRITLVGRTLNIVQYQESMHVLKAQR